jgi:hypothetical protein
MRGVWVRKPEAKTAVIFVHGILSNGETCWLHENGTYWPDLLRQEQATNTFGVYVFTYETGVFSGSYGIGNVVDALKEHMRLDGVLDNDRLIFVCHSMGGIVVRKYIVERVVDLIDGRKKIGVFLVASPSLGAGYADLFSVVAKVMGHSQADALRFVRSNDWLADLDREFTNLKESARLPMKGKELVEDKFITLSGILRRQVVEPFSGARYFGEPFKVAGANHFSIAKPSDPGAIQHRLLCQFLLDYFPNSAISKPRDGRLMAQTVPSNFVMDRTVGRPTSTGSPRLLLGVALDTSGSMKNSIRNRSTEDLSRLDSVTTALADLGSQAAAELRRHSDAGSPEFHIFVYGFGLRIGDGVGDLASLWRAVKTIDLKAEVEARRAEFEQQGRARASAYQDLGSLLRGHGLGSIVDSAIDVATRSARQQVVSHIGERLLTAAGQIGDSTLTAEDLAQLFGPSSDSSNAEMIQQAVFGNTPMVNAANQILGRFSRQRQAVYEQKTLLVISDGGSTDGDPRAAFAAIRALEVEIVACFVTGADIANPRVLVGSPNSVWSDEVKLMWDIASTLDASSTAYEYFSAHGWTIEPNAKLFVQVNHSDVLAEFLRVAGSNISTRSGPPILPVGQ